MTVPRGQIRRAAEYSTGASCNLERPLPSVSVLIPYRNDSPERARNLAYVSAGWQELGVEVVVAETDEPGPFPCARLVNEAFLKSSGDIIVMWGADHVPDGSGPLADVLGWLESHPWCGMFGATKELDQATTEKCFSKPQKPAFWMPGLMIQECTGIMAMHRSTFEAAGGMDEAFTGWGYEDTTFRLILRTLFGECPMPMPRTLTSLWHPLQPRTSTASNKILYENYVRLSQQGREAMSAYIGQRVALEA